MKLTTQRALLFALLLTAATSAAAQVTDQSLLKPDPNDWLHYSGTYDAQRHSLLKQIDTTNVQNLQTKWAYHMSGAADLEAVPIVVNGVMYVSQYNRVDALDGRTGRLIWQYQRQPPARGWQRGVAVFGNKVYVGTADSYLVALDARNGHVLWQTKPQGEGYRFQGAAPMVAKGRVLLGGNSPTTGFLQAFDAETGKFVWNWNAVPRPGEQGSETWDAESWKRGGGPMWVSGSYDPALNLIYWGTGQPNPDFIGEIRKGDNLYSDSVVALDIDTGRLKWHFQFTPHDMHDWDANEMPVLVDAVFQGQPRKLLVQANRNGYYYILDRTNGKFLQGTPFVDKITWSSGLTPEGRPIVVAGHEPSIQGNLVCPSTAGATNWPSPAYSPDLKVFYLIATEGCGLNFRSTDNFPPGATGSGTAYQESPNEQESWQLYVRALDLTTGKRMWEYKQIGSVHYGPGLLSTAGGVLFAGEQRGTFTALDARKGTVLWHFNTGDLITAGPATYSIDGQQYVAIASNTNIFAFALPGPASR